MDSTKPPSLPPLTQARRLQAILLCRILGLPVVAVDLPYTRGAMEERALLAYALHSKLRLSNRQIALALGAKNKEAVRYLLDKVKLWQAGDWVNSPRSKSSSSSPSSRTSRAISTAA